VGGKHSNRYRTTTSLASISQTTTPQVPVEKRPRKDVSPSVTEVSADDFQVYRKIPKTSHTPDRSGGEETQYYYSHGGRTFTIFLRNPANDVYLFIQEAG
jgi:hypothetical protein